MFFLNERTETIQHLINIKRQHLLSNKEPSKPIPIIKKNKKINKYRHIRKYYNTKYSYMQYSLNVKYNFIK